MIAVILCRTSSIVWFLCQHSTISGSREDGEPAVGHVMHPGMAAIPYLYIATDIMMSKCLQLNVLLKMSLSTKELLLC